MRIFEAGFRDVDGRWRSRVVSRSHPTETSETISMYVSPLQLCVACPTPSLQQSYDSVEYAAAVEY